MNLSKSVHIALIKTGTTKTELAKAFNVSCANVTQITKKKDVSLKWVSRVANHLKYTHQYLINLSNRFDFVVCKHYYNSDKKGGYVFDKKEALKTFAEFEDAEKYKKSFKSDRKIKYKIDVTPIKKGL